MVYQPTSKVSFAKTTLNYPIYAAEFDPYSRGYLVVGGGGGESKTGVKNQISVLDVSNRASISTAAEIELSSNEDSVQSVSSLATKDGLITFAGINSSQAEQNAGKNEHFRSFKFKLPPRKKQRTEKSEEEPEVVGGEVELLGKSSLFKPSTDPRKETYQRLLRLSPAQKRESGNKRVGAIATGMARENEVVVFNATSASPADDDIIARIALAGGAEAADLDIAEPEESEFSLAYCTEFDICEQTYKYDFGTKKAVKMPNGPRRVYQIPFPDVFENRKSRPKFRSIRFLNPQNLITLLNKPNRGGAQLRIFHLYPTGPAALLLEKSLPSRIKQAVSMDVCALDADKSGNRQIVVAVAGQDVSIEVYVTNYQAHSDTFSPFKHYITLRNVHEHQMTKICFSPFHSPERAPEQEEPETGPNGEPLPRKVEKPIHPGAQYIRLASVSYGNSVVIDTFPLSPLDVTNKRTRYLLSHPNEETWVMNASLFTVVALVFVVGAFLMQGFIVGFSDDRVIGPFSWLPKNVREFLDQPANAAYNYGKQEYTASSAGESSFPTRIPTKGRLRALINHHLKSDDGVPKALVVHEALDGSGNIAVDVHSDKEAYLKEDTGARQWSELSDDQQNRWREKLVQAGEWIEGEGEKLFVGVFFSEYAGLVRQVVREASSV